MKPTFPAAAFFGALVPGLAACLVLATAAIPAPAAARADRPAAASGLKDDGAALHLARGLRSAGDAVSAIQLYRQVLAHKPSREDVRLELADTLLEANLIDQAIGTYGEIGVGSSFAAEAQLGLALAQQRLGRPDAALEHAQRAATLAPDNLRVLVGLGVALDRMGRQAEAQISYRRALVISPRSIAARNDLALSLALSRRYDEAIELLAPIARSADASPRDRQNLAFIYGLSGNREAALALSRVDLDDASALANARFFDLASKPPSPSALERMTGACVKGHC